MKIYSHPTKKQLLSMKKAAAKGYLKEAELFDLLSEKHGDKGVIFAERAAECRDKAEKILNGEI